MTVPARETIRLDKWLWYARFYKTRALASREVAAGRIRVNAARMTKPACPVAPGDTLTVARGVRVDVVRVMALGQRRGPAAEAQQLYDIISTAAPETSATGSPVTPGARPTGKARRALDRLRGSSLE